MRTFLTTVLVAVAFCAGCRTYSPEVQAMWRKYHTVKRGMTDSEVYAVVPSSGRFRAWDGREVESWLFAPKGFSGDMVGMTLVFGMSGQVEEVHRFRGHGHDCSVPEPVLVK